MGGCQSSQQLSGSAESSSVDSPLPGALAVAPDQAVVAGVQPDDVTTAVRGFRPVPALAILRLSSDELVHIHGYLDTKSLVRATATCRFFHSTIAHTLSVAASRLIGHVNKQEKTEVDALLALNPRLLLHRSKEANGMTAWQVALSTSNTKMLAAIEPYFYSPGLTEKDKKGNVVRLNGVEVRARQTREIISEQGGEFISKQEEAAFDFGGIVDAIRLANQDQLEDALKFDRNLTLSELGGDEKNSSLNPLISAIVEFKKEFLAKFRKEAVFNPQHLRSAIQMYSSRWTCYANNFWAKGVWSVVVCFVAQLVPPGCNCPKNGLDYDAFFPDSRRVGPLGRGQYIHVAPWRIRWNRSQAVINSIQAGQVAMRGFIDNTAVPAYSLEAPYEDPAPRRRTHPFVHPDCFMLPS